MKFIFLSLKATRSGMEWMAFSDCMGGELGMKGWWRRLEEKYFSIETISHVSHYFHFEKHTLLVFFLFLFFVFSENIWKTECFVGVLLLGKTVVQIVTMR